jgi:hypothetical protein
MARKRQQIQKKKPKKNQLGKLTPLYNFFLNPYTDARFTRCPQCAELTKVRTKPFVIHVDPGHLLNLNISGRYCPDCDLMILHQDEIEEWLAQAFALHNRPEVIGNDYLIIGTLERKAWIALQTDAYNHDLLFDNLHDFKAHVTFDPVRYEQAPDPAKQKDKPE